MAESLTGLAHPARITILELLVNGDPTVLAGLLGDQVGAFDPSAAQT